jgi:hypothetical protein
VLLTVIPLALAHPGYGSSGTSTPRSTVGQRMELAVGDTAVDLRYIAEVPERRVLEEARSSGEAGYGTKLLDTLAGNVHLVWDGKDLLTTRTPLESPVAAGESGFLDFTVALHADLPGHTGTLGIRNGNFPDELAFFATSMTLAGDLIAEETSLLRVKDGQLRDNWHGAWLRDETAREPWVKIRPAQFWETATGPEALPKRMAGVDHGGPPWWGVVLMALGLVPIALAGRWLGRKARGRHLK